MQAASSIAKAQQHQEVQAALQDTLAAKNEELVQLQHHKKAALEEAAELKQQLKEVQVCVPPASVPDCLRCCPRLL